MSGGLQDALGGPGPLNGDSISLGQLKAMVGGAPKPKQSLFDFKYDDEDTVMNEIEEFYSYIEMPQVAENLKAYEGSFTEDWTTAPVAKRKAYVDFLLEGLEHRDVEIRFTNARRLFYVLQGTFAEAENPEGQLRWIFENCLLVRSADGVSKIVEALKIAGHKHDLLCNISDADAHHLNVTLQEKSDLIEEVLTEVSVYLGMLYHIVEVLKGQDDFADELMSLDPPLPVYLFNVVAGLRDKSAKGYPIKKLLLLLWKTLLSCWGGVREHARVKKLTRELNGLSPIPEDGLTVKTTPIDIEIFRNETQVKYPTFAPSPQPPPSLANASIATELPAALTSHLSKAYSPIPVRHHYHHDDPSDSMHMHPHGHHLYHPSMNQSGFRQAPQVATPAPSPPPTPKQKKQQYQTDQSRPFLFPFSRRQMTKDGRMVPFAIDEAERLYNRHMYVSVSLAQMWKTREDCMKAESGLDRIPGGDGARSSTFNQDEAESGEPLPDIALIDKMIEESIKQIKDATSNSERRKAQERKEDLMRLKRVEQIYGSILPVLSGWVLVLLKLLLATVSASTNMQAPQSAASAMFPPSGISPQEQLPPPPATLDEIDVTRHREITAKAVSAILLLVMKWFKVSHVMKFHHLGQHLLDTNCLLLILKMFGLQEVSNSVVSKADSPENNFFRYCLVNLSKNPHPIRPEDEHRPSKQNVRKTIVLPNGDRKEEEIEVVTDYSWRNFFSTINFAKIMQKLSKGRSHRIWMLVQYKSSAVLKRVLRVNHPLLQLHVLKLIKSQVPFCGRKWRQSNMKVITSIYLNCRPELRDEWLSGQELDDAGDAQAQEQALRHLVKFYNTKRYGPVAIAAHQNAAHRRAGSMSQMDGLQSDPALSSLIRPVGTPNMVDSDVFPPVRPHAPDPSIFLPYIPEDIAFEEEYEEYLSDMGWSDDLSFTSGGDLFTTPSSAAGSGTSAWSRLPELVSEMTDSISDSESVVSIGDLGDENRLDPTRGDENVNNWEHMSPKTMAALPKSPAGGRRSSSGTGLRPVLPFTLDEGSAIDDDDEELAPPHMTREPSGDFPAGASVDEVEYAYGMQLFLFTCVSTTIFQLPAKATNDKQRPTNAMSQQQGLQQILPDQPPPQDLQANYYPQESDLTGGLPINLDSLRDGPPGSKPFYPYSTLIRYAIKGSPNQKLLLEDIYYAIESRFPYFRTAPSGWKNSVRHNLSLNPCFEKVPRPLTDRGKGSYWTVNDNVDPRTGVHRVRKKKTKGSKARASEEPTDQDYHTSEPFEDPHQFVPPPVPDNGTDASRQQQQQPVPYPYPYNPMSFDPNFQMMAGMRYPPIPGPMAGPVPMSPDENFELDETGNINWPLAWHKELGHLQQITEEQDKAGVDPEWYRMMLFRVRTALMPPPLNPEVMHAMGPPPHMQPPQPTPTDLAQPQQPPQQ